VEGITRQEFAKYCALGLCSAACVLVPEIAVARDSDSAAEWSMQQLDAVRIRYAKFLEILGRELDEPTQKKVLEDLGRECATEFGSQTFGKYKDNIDGFLQSIQQPSGWVETVEYDKAAGTIRIIDRSRKCSCPLVKEGATSAQQCHCSLGWQKETYSQILGTPVGAEVEESILRGGKRCVFRIKLP